jgi:hypothetical protein
MKSFASADTDTDGDGYVSSGEMRGFVDEYVAGVTDGKQNPTVDRDNIYQELLFPVVEEGSLWAHKK